jgi:hypothetical protein
MPYLRRNNTNGKWVARANRDGITYCLGSYDTYDEAWDAEMEFAANSPSRANGIRIKVDPSAPRKGKTFLARRYRGGYIKIGRFSTYEEARAAEVAFDATHPRRKPGPLARERANAH